MLSRHNLLALLCAIVNGVGVGVFAGESLPPPVPKTEVVETQKEEIAEPVTDIPFVPAFSQKPGDAGAKTNQSSEILTTNALPKEPAGPVLPAKPDEAVRLNEWSRPIPKFQSNNPKFQPNEPAKSRAKEELSEVAPLTEVKAPATTAPIAIPLGPVEGPVPAPVTETADAVEAGKAEVAPISVEKPAPSATNVTVAADDVKPTPAKEPDAPTKEGAADAKGNVAVPSIATGVVTKSNRGAICDDDELESVYQPATIEGYAGWKKNKVRREQLIDNDVIGIYDRWRIGLDGDSRHVKGNMFNPYRQNMIKGDYPIIGQSLFLNATFVSDTVIEGHSNPTPAGVSTARPGDFQFFGRPDQFLMQQNFTIALEFFKGETDFKPREWEIRATPVFNFNYTDVEENFAIDIDPRERSSRLDQQVAFQELFGEYHFRDLTPNFDFISSRTGIQFFNTDFRGFLFADNNLGARIFGNLESNRLQYNLAYFEMLNKDTNSGLNTFNFKDHHVMTANLIRQDCFIKGYNMIANVAYSNEETSRRYNENGVIVRPAPIGNLAPHANKVGYVGFGGDGHIGRLNVSHQFYQAFGEDTNNNIAGKRQRIDARMAALETSVDFDWMRFRASYFYASGDGKTFDGKANGFDAIFDDPNFAGGGFSWWSRQGGFGAGNALTQLKSRSSLLPNLNTSKGEGQRNFVNPGLHLFNLGYDAELMPNLKAVINANYLQFDNTSSLEELLHQNGIDKKIGYDTSLGIVYRPFLNNQFVINSGVSALMPLQGFKDIYSRKTLYAGFMGITLKY